jgi:tRNA(His) 5'-end guanylyltransferase
MPQTLQQRQIAYENSYDYNIIGKIPVILKIDGRNFSRLTKSVEKPYCFKTSSLLSGTMLALVKQIEGAVFGYQYSDKIIIIIKNDSKTETDPWFGNRVQKLSSIASSLATFEFLNNFWQIDEPPSLEGSILFTTHVFGIPDVTEVINYCIYRQFRCLKYAIDQATYSFFLPKYGRQTKDLLEDKGTEERRELLISEGFDFDGLTHAFRYGIGSYLIPNIVNTNHGQATHHKWVLDTEIPLFANNKEFLRTIISTGSDVFRPGRY